MSRSKLIVFTFLGTIVLGTLLLMLPVATLSGDSISLIDALFISTSAVCVTGLTTLNVAETFAPFGQVIIFLLIQLGGLGIMTLSAALLVLFRRRLDRTSHQLVSETYNASNSVNIRTLLRAIVLVFFVAEVVGAICLFILIGNHHPDLGERLWFALFHSVSAFCNAGFSLYPDGLVTWQSDYLALMVTMGLIILGGIGFFVVDDLRRYFYGRGRVLAVQTKLVLTLTVVLITVGTVGIWIAEYGESMSTMGFFESWFHALFQSVSARTAGFNTIDFTAISDFGLFVIICLMLIGGSPGSTAGGMKTTTVGIAVMTLRAHLVGRDDVELFQRRIRKETVQRSFLIIFLMLLLIGVAFVILRAGQLYNPTMEIATGERKFVLMPLGFETVSAACTVGMSAGFTDRLTGMGKLVVVVLMFAGRIGPLTLALALVSREAKVNYRLPYEEVMVG